VHGIEQPRETRHPLKTNDGGCRGLTKEEIIWPGKPLMKGGQPILCRFGLQNRNGFNRTIDVINVLKPLIYVVEARHGLGEQLGSGDGEREASMTRQMPYEPLPASVLFALGWSLIGSAVMQTLS
jgi:hypothetical protein